MIVYVESNFCLELAFQQEEEVYAHEILQFAEAGKPQSPPPDSHAFLSRNSNDFNLMRGEFSALGCPYIPKFEHGMQFIRRKI